jgi:hypothetical protein
MCGVLCRVDFADENFSRSSNEKLLIVGEVYQLRAKLLSNVTSLPLFFGNIKDLQLVVC